MKLKAAHMQILKLHCICSSELLCSEPAFADFIPFHNVVFFFCFEFLYQPDLALMEVNY